MPSEVRFAALVSATVVVLASLAVVSVPVAAGSASSRGALLVQVPTAQAV
jgi:hypothetical protein